MATKELEDRIHGLLKRHFPGDTVDVTDGIGECIEIVVVSRKFDGKTEKQKIEFIEGLIRPELTKRQLAQVSLIIGVSPLAIKGAH